MPRYAVLIHLDKESGGYLVEVPDLPGVITEGVSKRDAIENAREVIRSHLAFFTEEGDTIPDPTYDAESVAVSL